MAPDATGPPPTLVAALTRPRGPLGGVEWHPTCGSTNALALAAAARGAPTPHLVATDEQTAGRGRLDRRWTAPPGTSLLTSFLLRPELPTRRWPLLATVAGVALARTASEVVEGVTLKWPNDLLVDGVKAAGILVQASGDVAVVGIGLNVDWRGVPRPDGVALTSLAEAAGADVDRWDVLARLCGHLLTELDAAHDDPDGVVGRYRPWCETLGRRVRVTGARPVEGVAVDLTPEGALVVDVDGEPVVVPAGDVEHVRPAG